MVSPPLGLPALPSFALAIYAPIAVGPRCRATLEVAEDAGLGTPGPQVGHLRGECHLDMPEAVHDPVPDVPAGVPGGPGREVGRQYEPEGLLTQPPPSLHQVFPGRGPVRISLRH